MATLSASGDARPTPTPLDVGRSRRWRLTPAFSVGALVLLAGSLALRLVLWWRAEGFEQGDPVEYVNIAYKIAFGIGIEWWDLRPLLLSLIYVPVLYVAQLWPDPTGEAMVKALRLVGVLFATGSTLLVYLLGRRLGGEIVGLGAALLVAVNPVFNRLSVSTFAEVPSTFFLLLAVWLLVLAYETGPSVEADVRTRRLAAGAGLALGVGCMIRYQAIFFLPAIGVWLLAVEIAVPCESIGGRVRALLNRGSRAVWFGLGLLIAVVAQGIVELVAYGRPYHSLLASYTYNVTSGLAPVEFGAEPFGWFLQTTPEWFGLLPGLLVLVGVVGAARSSHRLAWGLVGLTAAVMFLALSAMPHKEDRFMAQVMPLLALFAAGGAAFLGRFAASADRGQHRGFLSGIFATALLVASAIPMYNATATLDLASNVAYVDGPKRAAQIKPGGVMGTIPWFVPRPYTGSRLTLERMDRNVWKNREQVAQTIETSDFLLFPEYWLLEDREIDRLVDARFRSVESYENGVVLYVSRRIEDPSRRRSR